MADGRLGRAAQAVLGTAIEHRVLATRRTSTMQNELNEAADQGFHYRGQTVFSTRFGGKEVVAILERNKDARARVVRVQALRDDEDLDVGEGAAGGR